jgi:very-short-patch-repair endonuclease
MLQGVGDTQARSKRLRRDMSPAEIALWMALRARPNGLKFRRQHPSGPFTADFYCHKARLVIEVDGTAHDYGYRPRRDAARDRWFDVRGIATLRITARDILRDCDAAIRDITAVAADRVLTGGQTMADAVFASAAHPLHQPAAGPPPRAGEEWEAPVLQGASAACSGSSKLGAVTTAEKLRGSVKSLNIRGHG